MPSEQELLACPFCGNDGSGPIEHALHVAFNEHDWRGSSWTVQCDKCTATMGYSDSEGEAVDAWNTRPAHSNQMDGNKALDEATIMEAAERVHAAHMAAHMRLGGDLTAWTWEEASKSFYRDLAIAALSAPAPDKALMPEAAVEEVANAELARLIANRLLSIPPDAQDLVLEDHDWRRIIAALTNSPPTSVATGEQARYAGMLIEERANAMADDGAGDPWELVGYFREKLRQAKENAALTTPTPVEEPANAATGESLADWAHKAAKALDAYSTDAECGLCEREVSSGNLARETLASYPAALAATNAGQVEAVARILCRQAGYDPDGGPKRGYGWINYEKNAQEVIAALTNGQANGEDK